MARTNVYQTDDAKGAAGIVDGFYAEVEPTAKPANPVKNMPDSRCLQFEDGGFYCLAAADRYAIETSGPNLLDTQQQVAARRAAQDVGAVRHRPRPSGRGRRTCWRPSR